MRKEGRSETQGLAMSNGARGLIFRPLQQKVPWFDETKKSLVPLHK
jgi:hypothetical protein